LDLATHSYEGVASFYDELASIYSFGRIESSKRCFLDQLEPGQRVLFVGVGRGRDALAAARRGVNVTAIDLSPRMLAGFEAGLAREGLTATVLRGDVAEHCPDAPYDAVVAHYFLNLYDAQGAREMLAVLLALLRPGGQMLIADFAPAPGQRLSRVLTGLYYGPVNWIAWLLGFCALHPILDYPALLRGSGLRIVDTSHFPLLPGVSYPAYLAHRAERIEAEVD
jgi:demethylmenaquinone methyltransferase/2-methoxy-6-polyprenyl-1,4-benzoquinol methylase